MENYPSAAVAAAALHHSKYPSHRSDYINWPSPAANPNDATQQQQQQHQQLLQQQGQPSLLMNSNGKIIFSSPGGSSSKPSSSSTGVPTSAVYVTENGQFQFQTTNHHGGAFPTFGFSNV